jgi:hypothetical protein
VQGVRGSQIKTGPGISACGPGARARRRFRAAGARGRRRKERGAGALTCGTERPERGSTRARGRSVDRRVQAVRERKREREGAARAADLG